MRCRAIWTPSNTALEEDQFLYREIVTEGILLWDTGIEIPKAKPQEPARRRAIAARYFLDFFGENVEAFQRAFEYQYQSHAWRLGSHFLHRLAPFLLVYTNAKPHTHNLPPVSA